MRGVFETIPKELPESARIDGASSFTILTRIMLPLVRNGIVVVLITNFIAAWGEWLLANKRMTVRHDLTRACSRQALLVGGYKTQ